MVELLNQMALHDADNCTLLQLFTRMRATILKVSPFNGRFNDPREVYKHPERYPSNRRPPHGVPPTRGANPTDGNSPRLAQRTGEEATGIRAT